jgi:hypothetical protein
MNAALWVDVAVQKNSGCDAKREGKKRGSETHQ